MVEKAIYTADTFDYSKVKIGDLVDAKVVMNAMDLLPPACNRKDHALIDVIADELTEDYHVPTIIEAEGSQK